MIGFGIGLYLGQPRGGAVTPPLAVADRAAQIITARDGDPITLRA